MEGQDYGVETGLEAEADRGSRAEQPEQVARVEQTVQVARAEQDGQGRAG